MGDSAVFVRRMLGMVVAGGLVVALAQSLAASPATAGEVTISGVTYTCTAKNSVIDQSLGGPQQMIVEARTTLPDTVTSGSTVPATTAQLKLTLPVALVNQLYGPMEVRRVKGEANSDVVVSGVAPGGQVVQTLNRPVNNLKVDDWVTLQQGSPVTIVANGNVDAIPVPQFSGNGLIYVTMPKTFLLRPLLDPPVIGRIGDTIGEGDMDCVRNEDTSAARVIGTIPVGAGCSQSDCALPSDAQSTTPTTAPTTGTGSGTDPGSSTRRPCRPATTASTTTTSAPSRASRWAPTARRRPRRTPPRGCRPRARRSGWGWWSCSARSPRCASGWPFVLAGAPAPDAPAGWEYSCCVRSIVSR